MEKDASKILEPEVSYATAQSSSVFSILEFIKKGIKYNQFIKYIQQTPFSISEWSEFLHISERTLHRYQKDKKTFDATHTEKIMEIILVYKKGIEVFGNNKNFDAWLVQKNIALANKMPKEFLTSSTGLKLLMKNYIK